MDLGGGDSEHSPGIAPGFWNARKSEIKRLPRVDESATMQETFFFFFFLKAVFVFLQEIGWNRYAHTINDPRHEWATFQSRGWGSGGCSRAP